MPLSGYQREQLFTAKRDIRDSRHQAKITGIRLGGLMDQLKFQQDDLAGQERVHEYVRKTARGDARVAAGQERYVTDTNLSLDAPDPDDDRNIRPVYEGTREQQLEGQIRMLEEVDARTSRNVDKGWGITGPILAVLAIFIAGLNWNKKY